MKFKVGQKVCVVEWLNMPSDAKASYGINTYKVGNVGFIRSIKKMMYGVCTYKVAFDKHLGNDLFAFEGELESIIKIGEQLMFEFMRKE